MKDLKTINEQLQGSAIRVQELGEKYLVACEWSRLSENAAKRVTEAGLGELGKAQDRWTSEYPNVDYILFDKVEMNGIRALELSREALRREDKDSYEYYLSVAEKLGECAWQPQAALLALRKGEVLKAIALLKNLSFPSTTTPDAVYFNEGKLYRKEFFFTEPEDTYDLDGFDTETYETEEEEVETEDIW